MPRPVPQRVAALVAAAFVLFAGLTCSEITGPKPRNGLRAVVGLTPVFSKAATEVLHNLVSFQLAIDNIHVQLVHANGNKAIDTTAVVTPGQSEVVLNLSVELDGASEELDATIDLRDGEIILFTGKQKITARTGGNSPPEPPIPVEYAGPGSTVTSLDVQPDTTITGLEAIQMRPVARDANNQPVTNLNLLWSLEAGTTLTPTVGAVTESGLFQPTGSRGTAIVSATLPTGIKGSATVTIAPPASLLALISGNNQTGAVGTALAPIVVEVQATDGGPFAGQVVDFAVTSGGGSLSIATATTGSNGRVSVVLTLGQTVGANSIQITSPGLTPITVTATATPGAAAKLVMVQQPSANAVTGVALGTQPSVQLQDAFSNVVPTANVAVTAGLTTPAGRTLQGTLTANTNASGVATFTDLAIAGLTGQTTLTFTSGSLTPAVSSSIAIAAGAPATLSATTPLTSTDTAGANVAAGQLPAVVVRDASSNPLQGVQVRFIRRGGAGSTLNSVADGVIVTSGANGAAALTSRRLQTVVGVDTVLVKVDGVTDSLSFVATVTPASATQLVMVQQPSSNAVLGVVFATQPSVRIMDAFGNAVLTANAAVTAALTSAGGRTLQGTLSANTNASGVATFTDLAIAGPTGQTTLTFTSGSLTPAISSTISVTTGAATSIIAGSPVTTSDTAGANALTGQLPVIIVRDASSNPVEGLQVKFRRHGGAGATINAQQDTLVLATTDANGAAALSGRRLQTLVGLDTVLATAAGVNDTLRFVATVTHAAPTQLAFVQQPGNGTPGVPIAPAPSVSVRDQYGNLVNTGAGASASITMTVSAGSLTGTTAVAASLGLATFSNLIVPAPGSGLQLVAVAEGLTNATSSVFSIAALSVGTKTWIGGATGNWETASSWSGGQVPVPGDTVIIDGADANVSLSSAASIAKLRIGASGGVHALIISGPGSGLTVSDSVVVNPSGILDIGIAGASALSTGPMVVNGAIEWFGGTISGSGSISIGETGVMFLAGTDAKTLSGRAIQNQGTFFFGSAAPGNLTLSNGATILNNPGFEFLIQSDASVLAGAGGGGSITNLGNVRQLAGSVTTTTIAVPFENGGTGVIEIQEGGLAFTASLNNTANATIRGQATLDVIQASFTNAGTLAPGLSPGELTVLGNVTMQATSKIAIELGGPSAGTDFDLLNVDGAVSLGGTLEVSLINGYTPQVGQNFTVIEGSPLSGAFTTMTGLDLGGGLFLQPVQTSQTFGFVVVQSAATVSWASPVNGNWNDPTKWTTGLVPGISDIVAIDVAGTYTVTLNVNPTITGLNLGGSSGTQTLSGDARVLTVNGATNVMPSGVLNLVNSNLTGSGTLTNQGQVILQNGTVTATQTLTNQALFVARGSSAIDGPLNTTPSSTIRVEGSSSGSSAALAVTGGGFTNFGLLELTSIDGGFSSTLTLPAGTLTNAAGAILRSAVGAGGLRTLTAELVNQGTLDVDQPLTLARADAEHVNNGTIDLTNADLVVNQGGTTPSFTNANSVLLGTNRTWTVTGGTLDLLAGAVTGQINSTLNMIGLGTIAFTPANIAVQLTLSSVTVAGNQVTIGEGQTLTLLNGALSDPVTVQAGGTLVSHGTVTLDALSVMNSGVVRAQGNTTGGTSQLTVTNGFNNGGLIELTSIDGNFTSTFVVTSGTLFNLDVGTIRSAFGPGGVGGGRNLVAQLDNSGTLDVDVPLLLQASNADHVNRSTIDLAANLTVNLIGATPSFTNTSSANVSVGQNLTLAITGGDVVITAGTITGATTSTLAVSSSTLAFTTANVTLPMTVTNTTITNGPITIPSNETLTLLNGGLSAPVIVQSGGLLVSHGTVTLDSVNVTASGMLRVEGDPTGGASQLTVTRGFTNTGSIELTSIVGGFSSQLNVTNGSLTNSSTTTIRSATGFGGTRTLGAQLVNLGTLDVQRALTINKVDADHQNAGIIDLTDPQSTSLTVTQSGDTPSFTNTGTVTLAENRTLSVNGGTVSLAAGLVNGPTTSTLFVTNATLSFTADNVTLPMTLTNTALAGGLLTVPSSRTVTLLNGGLGDPVTIEEGGMLLTHGAVSLNGALTVQPGGVLRVQGDPTGGSATLTVATGFTNSGTIDLTSIDGGFSSQLSVTSGTLTNAANAIIESGLGLGGLRTLAAQLTNLGTLSVVWPLTLSRASSNHSNGGTIDLTNANLTISQSGTSPSFVNTSGGTITLGTSRQLIVSGGLLNLEAGSVSGLPTSTLVVSSAQLDLTPTSVTVPMTLTGTTLVDGQLTIASGETVTLLNGGLTDPVTVNAGTLVIHGTVSLQGLTVASSSPTSTLKIEGDPTGGSANLVQEGGFTNSGYIELASAGGGFTSQLTVNNGTLTQTNQGSLQTVTASGGVRTLAAQLNNEGTILVSQPLTINKTGAVHLNSGNIQAIAGDLTLQQSAGGSFTNTGNIALSDGRVWDVTGGALDLDEGSLTNTAARLIVTNGTIAFTPTTVTAKVTLINSTIQGGSFTIGTSQQVVLMGGQVSDPVTILSGGTLITEGTVALNGTLTQGGTLRVRGSTAGGQATLTVADGFINTGLIELTSIDAGFGSALAVTTGTLTNASGNILVSQGTGGIRTLTAEIDNQGTIDVNAGLTLNRLNGQHSNSGTINLSSDLSVIFTSGTFTNTSSGTITLLGANRTFSVSDGTLNVAQGTVTSAETTARLDVNSSIISFTPNTVSIPLQLVNSTVTGGINVGTSQTLTLVNSSLPTTAVSIGTGGTLVLRGGNTLDGSLTQNGVLRIEGSSFGGGASLTLADGFINNGLVDLTSVDGGFGSSLGITTGALLNSIGAVIRSSQGAGGSRTLTAELDNEGTVDVDWPLTINKASAAHLNGGTFDMAASVSVVQSGVTSSFTSNGTIAIPTGTAFTVSGGGTFVNGSLGVISGIGTVNVSGTQFSNDGQVSPGTESTAGTLTFTGNFTQTANGRVNVKLGGTVAGVTYDVLSISGAATLTNILNVTTFNGFTPASPSSFNIINYGSLTGAFSAVSPPAWTASYGATQLTLNVP